MVAISEIINSIEQRVQLLTSKVVVLEKQNAELIEKNQVLLEQNRTLQADLLLRNSEISQLEKQIESQDGSGVDVYERKHYLRKEIDQYIQDIDKCIEWLQNA